MNDNSPLSRISSVLLLATITTCPALLDAADPPRPVVKVVEGGESKLKPDDCRTTIVGPSVNQPDPLPCYGGCVAWPSPLRLKSG